MTMSCMPRRSYSSSHLHCHIPVFLFVSCLYYATISLLYEVVEYFAVKGQALLRLKLLRPMDLQCYTASVSNADFMNPMHRL